MYEQKNWLKEMAILHGTNGGKPIQQHNLEIDTKAKGPMESLLASRLFDATNRRK